MRKTRALTFGVALAATAALASTAGRGALDAQNRKDFSIVNAEGGHVALGLALRKLGVAGTFMQAPRIPTTRPTRCLPIRHGMGLRTIDLQNNRGDGGQNEIGPELFRDMARAAYERAAVGTPDRRRRAVFHARHRLRLFVRSRGSDRQVGPRGDRRRLRAAVPHAASGGRRDHEHPGRRRRSRARSDDHAGARSVFVRPAIREISRAACGKGCVPGSRESCISSAPVSAAAGLAAAGRRRPGTLETRRVPRRCTSTGWT